MLSAPAHPETTALPAPLLAALDRRLATLGLAHRGCVVLADQGLAHTHVVLQGTGWLARVPKHSQLNLPAAQHLRQEATCFERAAPSGHTPALFATLPPGPDLPWGALLVAHVHGQPAGAAHMGAVVDALAAIHHLPPPPLAQRPPLSSGADPVGEWLAVLHAQAVHWQHPAVPPRTRERVQQRLRTLPERLARACGGMPITLIAQDAHPGNFLVRPDGHAVLVDLEKMRYSLPPLDVAHATLYTSTTWDVATAFELTTADVQQACLRWLALMGPSAARYVAGMVPLREAMWLWSLAWCAKWLSESGHPARPVGAGEDWSHDHHSTALTDHVTQRARHYLSAACVDRQLQELTELDRALAS